MNDERDVRTPCGTEFVSHSTLPPGRRGSIPVLYAASLHNKGSQGLDMTGQAPCPTLNPSAITFCRSETVTHGIYHDPEHPSHPLLPVISKSYRLPPATDTVRFDRDGAIGRIVLPNPPFNRLDHQFSACLRQAVHDASESDIRALVVQAEGPHFSFGGEVREWPGKDANWFRTFVAEVNL